MFASHSSSGGTSASCSNCADFRLCFLSGTRSIVHSFFKHDNGFYRVREGDLLGRPFFSIQIKLMHGRFSTNLRPWIHSARSLLPPRYGRVRRMTTLTLPAVFMRGGTSKGLMFHQRNLPAQRVKWDPLFLAAMGSPDP